MDAEVAATIAALEHKLRALEQALAESAAATSAPATPAAAESEPLPIATAASRAPAEPSWAGPGDSAQRIVDESIEPAPQPQPRAPFPITQSPPVAPAPAAAPLAATAVAAPETPVAAALGAQPTSAPAAPVPPTAAELLRFRERLEQSTRELAHDYDELLGRLSYAAMPTTSGPTISFARGVPSLDIIDVEGLRDAAVRAFDSDPGGMTAYGTAVGYPRLRSWIADRHGVEPERVLLTNGSLQADAFLFDHLVAAGDEVIVESPTYDRTLLSLKGRGAQLHAVELQQDGIDTAALARLLDSGVSPKLAHVIPNFQNPAGYTLSLAKRQELVALARRHDFIVLEDDPYGDLRFSGEPMPTMVSLDPDHIVYASSFTKTVCPGVRVGYLIGPAEMIAAIAKAATNTYISPGMVSESIVYEFCASGAIERSIETVRNALQERAATLGDALRRELPEAEFVPPQGGYFLWVTLPQGTDVHALFDAGAAHGVTFVKGTDFLLEGGENTLRLAYSGVTTEQVDEGVARLAAAYRSL